MQRDDLPTKRWDLSYRTYQQLRELIVRGKLAPGMWIIESDIAARLGVSRTPVRGALQRLQLEGYVATTRRGRLARTFVTPLTKEDARELFGIIAALESIATMKVAGLASDARARTVRRMVKLNHRIAAISASDHPSPGAIFDADTAFHRQCLDRARGRRLAVLYDAIKPQSERYVRLYTSVLVGEMGISVAEHQAIIDAIVAGDPGIAGAAVTRNWTNASRRLGKVIDMMGERGTW
jgi:DNA-binding GntR family transcriptional regulator